MKNISVRLLALFLFLGLTSPLFALEIPKEILKQADVVYD